MRVGDTAAGSGATVRPVRFPSNSVNRSLARASRKRRAAEEGVVASGRREVADVVAGTGAGPQFAQAVLGGGGRELAGDEAMGVGVDRSRSARPLAASSGAIQRDSWCVAVARRSPRGTVIVTAGVVVATARN